MHGFPLGVQTARPPVASEGACFKDRAQEAEARTHLCPLQGPFSPCGASSQLCLCRRSLWERGPRAAPNSCASWGDSGRQGQGQGQPRASRILSSPPQPRDRGPAAVRLPSFSPSLLPLPFVSQRHLVLSHFTFFHPFLSPSCTDHVVMIVTQP